jgi:hypothetical protein
MLLRFTIWRGARIRNCSPFCMRVSAILRQLALTSARSPAPPTHRRLPTSEPGQPVPFAPPALPGFTAITGRSAPVSRLGTLPLAVAAAWGPPSRDQGVKEALRVELGIVR